MLFFSREPHEAAEDVSWALSTDTLSLSCSCALLLLTEFGIISACVISIEHRLSLSFSQPEAAVIGIDLLSSKT